jgi:hypothetical protein
MIAIFWPLCWLPLAVVGPQTPDARQSFELVKQLDSAKPADRERIRKELTNRPGAVWAVLWGSQRQNLDIRVPCLDILDDWKWQARLVAMVGDARGDFDRFVNSFFDGNRGQADLFARASEEARALDRLFMRKSFLSNPKGFPSLSVTGFGRVTPFHEFSAYIQGHKPSPFKGFLRIPGDQSARHLANCTGINTPNLVYSMAFSEGNVTVGDTSSSLVVCGGDAIFDQTILSSLIVAAGDVKLKGILVQVFVIAGGKITLDRPAMTHNMILVSPMKIDLPVRPKHEPRPLVFDGKPKPVSELFTFRDLWTDYGLETNLEQGRLRITKRKDNAPLAAFFRENDIVVSHKKTKIESAGQFRRLLAYSLDIGRIEFEIERAGDQVRIEAPLPKADFFQE